MKHKISSALLSAVILITGFSGCKSDERPEKYINPDYTDYAAKVEDYLDRCSYSGSVLVAKGDEIIYAGGFGYADEKTGAICTAKDTFEMGSISKQMTAAAILKLCERGKLSLDDKLEKYFPEFEKGKDIKLRNLLNMQSGLYDYIDDAHKFFPADFVDEYLRRADADNEDEPDFEREFLLPYLYEAPLKSAPESDFYYCNTDYYLLGLIIEYVSGKSYQDFIKEEIFVPCGMETANNGFMETTARGYYHNGTTLSMRTSTALGCGSVNGSVYDLYDWMRSLYGGRVISEESLKEMTTSVLGYGFGLIVTQDIYYHGGSTDVFNSYCAYYPRKDYYVIAFSNTPIEDISTTYVGSNLRKFLIEQ
ncbi:MAG: serine hydrolase domain-containing protein [Ruminiclostridium sp.]